MESAKQERREKAAAKTRGHNSIVYRRVEVIDGSVCADDETAIRKASHVFIPQCAENEGIRTEKDLLGDFTVMARRPFGVEKDGNIRRHKQEVTKIS